MEVQDPRLAELETLHKTKIYVIEGIDEAGNPLKMYLKKPDHKLKRAAMEILGKDQTAILSVGELFLAGCYVAGDNLYDIEDIRLEASAVASQLFNFNDTFTLKKS